VAANWTPDAEARLKALSDSGDFSNEQMASILNKEYRLGVTRNAVIGKRARKGWDNLRTEASKQRTKVYRAPPPKRRVPARIEAPPPKPAPVLREVPLTATATLFTLERHGCRWPIGDPQDEAFGYCGRDREGHRNYCPGHAPLGVARKQGESLDRVAKRYG
jgi:GcrA cell cycle regulator